MSGLFDGLMQELGSSGVSAIAGKLGMDSSQAEQAIQSALPMIVSALSRNSNDPQGAQNLRNALQQHANDASVQQTVQQVTQQAEPDSDAQAMLGHIFGSKQSAAGQGVSHAGGINAGNAMNLMGMLAPLNMGYVAKQSQQTIWMPVTSAASWGGRPATCNPAGLAARSARYWIRTAMVARRHSWQSATTGA